MTNCCCKGHFFTKLSERPTDRTTDRRTTRLLELLKAAKNRFMIGSKVMPNAKLEYGEFCKAVELA